MERVNALDQPNETSLEHTGAPPRSARSGGLCWTECQYRLTTTEHWAYVLFRYYETWETDVDYKAILDGITGLPGTIVGVGLGALPAASATAVTGVSVAGTIGAIGVGAIGAGIVIGAYIDKALFPAEQKTGDGWIPDGFGPYDTGMKVKNTWSLGKHDEVPIYAFKQYRPPRRKWETKVRSRQTVWLDCSPRIPCSLGSSSG